MANAIAAAGVRATVLAPHVVDVPDIVETVRVHRPDDVDLVLIDDVAHLGVLIVCGCCFTHRPQTQSTTTYLSRTLKDETARDIEGDFGRDKFARMMIGNDEVVGLVFVLQDIVLLAAQVKKKQRVRTNMMRAYRDLEGIDVASVDGGRRIVLFGEVDHLGDLWVGLLQVLERGEQLGRVRISGRRTKLLLLHFCVNK